jgi:hypothetical protein
MNETETKTADASELSELKRQCRVLSRQVLLSLLALFVVSGTLTVYLGIQSRRVGKDLEIVRPQARQVVEASAKEEPVIRSFMAKLVDYGKAHPDFAPIVAKYRLTTNAPIAGSSAGVTPPPTTPEAPGKAPAPATTK